MSGLLRGLVRERACRGGAEGEARSAVLYWGSLTVPRAEAAGTRGRGVPGDGAWHWDVGALGSGTPAMHCLTAWEQWAVQLLQCTASLPGGSGQCSFCNALPHCLGAVDSAISAMHYPTAWGQWAVDLRQYTDARPGGSGQCNSCNALPHCLGAVGSGTPAMHRFTA